MVIKIDKKYIKNHVALKDIFIEFPVGMTTLIIGTSGAGKSTLIKCLTGIASFEGELIDCDRRNIAYIPQSPALNMQETVKDAIYWSAKFSHSFKNEKNLATVVNQYIEMMGLEHVRNNVIEKLSGGQRQRVSIAKELIRGKTIVIADEIDTGLDCGVSQDLIEKLTKITHEKGMTTIVISHNIVNIEMYDRVVVLVREVKKDIDDPNKGKGPGRIAYWGTPDAIRSFFEVDDYVTILKKVNSVDEGGLGEANYYIDKFNKIYQKRR